MIGQNGLFSLASMLNGLFVSVRVATPFTPHHPAQSTVVLFWISGFKEETAKRGVEVEILRAIARSCTGQNSTHLLTNVFHTNGIYINELSCK